MQNIDWLSDLKLRISYAEMGTRAVLIITMEFSCITWKPEQVLMLVMVNFLISRLMVSWLPTLVAGNVLRTIMWVSISDCFNGAFERNC